MSGSILPGVTDKQFDRLPKYVRESVEALIQERNEALATAELVERRAQSNALELAIEKLQTILDFQNSKTKRKASRRNQQNIAVTQIRDSI